MMLIRAFDSLLPELYTRQLIRGSSHAAIGQEAVAVGACAALAKEDYITSTHRGHGHTIAKGGDVNRMMAELLGRQDGYCRGKGGSMHIADFSIGMLGANGIVGGGFGIATGAALSAQMRRSGQVALCFFGDGALNQSSFHGAANLAGIWRLPLILLCENNQFAMSARAEQMIAGGDPAARAAGYGFPGVTVDGMDVIAVHDAVAQARERALNGEGPTLVVATCYRFLGHFSGDTQSYRSKEEVAPWLKRDPLPSFRDRLLEEGVLSPAAADAMDEEVQTQISDALAFAQASPWPDPAQAWEDVHA
ncbi:MAG: thiamine pyrophosphate-dependent dehydrogenase E1 component subunit alpha [Candidatus Dormibacteraeota bacterium]|nr:thiamine pyrophosphate-dependent dehydrogenase E1 component subunit alpha [Candidatus Dormibacteraeota bacterium]